MSGLDRVIITLGGLLWISGLLIAAYGLGFADAMDRPYRPPNFVAAMVLAGFALWIVGLLSERVRRSIQR